MLDTSKLKSGKYCAGSFKGFKKTRGWLLGTFFDSGSPLKTEKVEVLYREQKAGDIQEAHYHREKVEVLLFLEGGGQV